MINIDSVYSYYLFSELLRKILHIFYVMNYVVTGIHDKTPCIFVHM